MQQAAQLMLQQKMMQAGGPVQGNTNMAQQQVAQQTPPDMEQIRQQMPGAIQ